MTVLGADVIEPARLALEARNFVAADTWAREPQRSLPAEPRAEHSAGILEMFVQW